jgi:hypothetical protein
MVKFVISGYFGLPLGPSGLLFSSFDDDPPEGLWQLRKNKEKQNNKNMQILYFMVIPLVLYKY